MKRVLWVIAVVCTFAAVAAGSGAYWLLYTEEGLAWIVSQVPRYAGTALTLDGVRGTLARGIAIDRLEYRNPETTVTANAIALRIPLSSLVLAAPFIASPSCERLVITTTETKQEPRKPPASLALPVPLYIDDAHIRRAIVERSGTPIEIDDISFSYGGGVDRHRVLGLKASIKGIALIADGTIDTASPFPVRASIGAKTAENLPFAATADLRGTLLELSIAAEGSSGQARAELNGVVLPFKEQPLQQAAGKLSAVDLRAYIATLPETNLSGTFTLRRDGDVLVGPVQLANARAGPWDEQRIPLAALHARVRTDLLSARLTDLIAELGTAGQLTGSGELRQHDALFRLRTAKFNLKGLHSELQETHLAGHVDVALAAERQTATGELAQDDAHLAFHAERMGDTVQLREFRLQARGGELQGRGRLALDGARPYAVTAKLNGFDPAAWGNFPAGSLKGKIALDGTLKDKSIAALYALDDSRLLGMKLSSRGDVRYAANRVIVRYGEVRLGSNQLAASGAFGGAGDKLSVRVNASSLGELAPQWAGRASGSAVVSGTWQAPRAAFDVYAKQLAYMEHNRVAALALKGEYRHERPAAFRLNATANGIVTPGWRTERATLDASGNEAVHTVALQVRNSDIDLALHAHGAWETGKGWSGTLSDLTNRGAVPFALDSAVSLEIAQDRARIGPFTARIMGGVLRVAGIRYESGRLASEGRYSELPVRPFLALAGMPTRPTDTLRLSGAWSLAYTPQLNGYFTLERDSGDLAIGAERALPLGLQIVRCDGKIIDDRVELHGVVRSALVAGKIDGTVSPTSSATGQRITLDSPVRFAASVDVARIAAFSALMDANMHIDGHAQAALSGGGTLRKPVLSGTLAADQLLFSLPPEGLDLRDGTLRAELADNEVRVQQLSMHGGTGVFTAQGTLGTAAKRASLDWRAERLTLLGRPDRRLVVTGAGNARLEGGKVTLSGQLRAESGSFQFGGGTLPTLGDDVVIVGRAPPKRASQPGKLAHAALDLALDFGNNMHIVGQGLDTWINGQVRVQTDASGKILAQGNVLTERGSYTAFGQRLQIERGHLIFNGPLDNPGLDVVAMRKNQAVEAGVAVTGTITSPYVRIVSEPPVPESEALAWLVLGHGPADASRGDLAMLPLAAASLFGTAKAPQGSFAQRLGVDTIALRGSTLNSQVVAVGKRVSHNLYVIYEQALGATTNVLKLELSLTQRLLMRAETGQTSALGLFFRYAFD